MPLECPFEDSPFGRTPLSNAFPEPWPGQQGVGPRSYFPAGRDDLPRLTDNPSTVGSDANSPVDHVERVDQLNQTDVGSQEPSADRPGVQKPRVSSNVPPRYRLLNTENTQNLSESVNASSAQKLTNVNDLTHEDQPLSRSELYFQEFLSVNENQSTTAVTTKPPVSNTTSAVSTRNTTVNSTKVTPLV